jgi:1-acyl-sn-glycerol-3-phosphate acyltransferase
MLAPQTRPATRLRRIARPLLPKGGNGLREAEGWPLTGREARRVVRKLRAVRKLGLVLLWTLLAIPVQTVLILIPGHSRVGRFKVLFARFYWSTVARLLGVRIRVVGRSAARGAKLGARARALARARGTMPPARSVVFVCNHSSWLDIPVVGGRLTGCFVSKDEVARWPVINVVARLGRTIFVSRKRGGVGAERDDMRARLAAGDNIILFPEGTSSDGSRVLPFRSAFFAAADAPAPGFLPPLIQPVSVVYDRKGWLPAGRESRSLFAWYGDMNLAAHAWAIAQQRGLRATIWLHPPVEAAAFPARRALAQSVWQTVADGAAALRQNRPPRLPQPPPAVVAPPLGGQPLGGQPAPA